MIKSAILSIAVINWITGMTLILISKATRIISITNHERTGWNKYRMGYRINEIRKVIDITNNETIKKKLKVKIIQRKFAYWLFISTPILIVIGNLIQ